MTQLFISTKNSIEHNCTVDAQPNSKGCGESISNVLFVCEMLHSLIEI